MVRHTTDDRDVTITVDSPDGTRTADVTPTESGFAALLLASSRNTIDCSDADDDRIDAVYDALMSPAETAPDGGAHPLRCDGAGPIDDPAATDSMKIVRRGLRSATDDALTAIFADAVDEASSRGAPTRFRMAVSPGHAARLGIADAFGTPYSGDTHPVPGSPANVVAFTVHPDDDVATVRNRVLQSLTATSTISGP